MSKVTPVISNFTRGELSPRMEGRSDVEAFFQGVSELQNMIVLPQGGAQKRPGTSYFSTVQTTTKKSRLIPFVVDEDQRYVLELYDGGIRVIRNNAGTRAFLTTVYVLTLDVAPSSDWPVGSEIEGATSGTTARVLAKNSGTEWVISEPSGAWTDNEVLNGVDSAGSANNADQGAGYPTSASSTVSTPVYGTSDATFYAEAELFAVKYVQVNNQMVLTHENHEPQILTRFDDTGWVLAPMDITIPTFVATNTTQPTGLKDQASEIIGGSSAAIAYKEGTVVKYSGSYYRAIQDISQSTDPSTETSKWQVLTGTVDDNPFDTPDDHPRASSYFQDRVILGGTKNRPNTAWGSGTGRYQYFVVGPADADPWSFDFLSDRSDKIQWIAAREVLVIGTTGGEWVIAGGQNGITPSSVLAKKQTNFGSSTVQGKLINENIVFVQKGGRKFREYYYQNELQAYRAADLTFYSDHITESGVVDFMFQSDPDPILWAVLADGNMIGLTYDKANGVEGWHRHVTDGEVESLAIIPAGNEDEIWITVKRSINGSDTRYIEYFAARQYDELCDRMHLDSALTLDGGASFSLTGATAADPVVVTAAGHGLSTGDRVRITDVTGMTELEGRVFVVTVSDVNTFSLDNEDGTGRTAATAGTVEKVYAQVTGLSHLEGESVKLSVDGGPQSARTVSGGTVTLDSGTYGNVIHVGLPFTARLKTMNVLAAMAEATRGRLHGARVRFIETTHAKVGKDYDTATEIVFREPTTPYGEVAELFTGEKPIEIAADYGTDTRVCVVSDQPTPLTVAVILPEMGVYAGGR